MNQPPVNIFVLNWNAKDLTLDCLESLKKISYKNANVIVIDNGSEDESVSAIKKQYPEFNIIELPENLGFSGGNNAGFKTEKSLSKYIIFLNNDTLVNPNFVEPLIAELEKNPNSKQAAPKIFYADTSDTIWFAGGKISFWLGLIRHSGIRRKDSPAYSNLMPVDYVTGCCVCMRTMDFKSIGMFDDSFPMYGEDVDLSLKFKKNGGNVIFVPESKIWHKVSSSIGGIFSIKKYWKRQKGIFKVLKKHSSPLQFFAQIILLPLRLGIEGFTILTGILIKERK